MFNLTKFMPISKLANNQKGISTFWGISLVVIEAMVVFFVFYLLYFFWIENPTPTSNILIVRAFQKESTLEIPTSVNTEGWQYYIDEERGFSFRYPDGYTSATDEIVYNTYAGSMVSLRKENRDAFSLRFFSVNGEEDVDQAFERITGIRPVVFQSFQEEVSDTKAVVYRQAPGEPVKDRIYFIANGYFFESAFDELSTLILATFKFL